MEIIEHLQQLIKACDTDLQLREKLQQNPQSVLEQFGIALPTGQKPIIEICEGYPIFIGILTQPTTVHPTHDVEHAHLDCLHY